MDSYLSQAKILLGGVDVLVNNAAFLAHYDSSEDFLDKTIQTNIKSVYLMCQKAADLMISENGIRGGKIINVSSINSFQADIHPTICLKEP